MRALVPSPVSMREPGGAAVRLASPLRLSAPEALAEEARYLRRLLEEGAGLEVDLVGDDVEAEIALGIGARSSPNGVEGAYGLEIGSGRVALSGDSPRGVFYGLQTLRQLLPPETLRRSASGAAELLLEPLEIEDFPRFSWRGVHLDVCRHFMPKAFLLKLIDLAAFHKCNVFHLHMTEDQGWRVPIARWPRLTEVGAWRRESSEGHLDEARFDGKPHGGHYSREDLAEVFSFAAKRHVMVLPEIDMPGHMVAAIAAYPELGNVTEPVEVLTEWGISEHVLNLEESTVQFCRDVIDEVAELFPGAYFHVGGDECPTTEWETSERAGEIMAREGYSDVRQLQGWFTALMAEHLDELGRTLVGWDEILEGGAPPGAVVMSWRGEAGGIAAASAGHDVVMTPEEWLYFDWAYADDPAEPVAIRAATSVEKVYGYDPVSEEIPEDRRHHVLGAQCQLWTEYVPTPEQAEYLYFPRLCAMAEALWSPALSARGGSYGEFEQRLGLHLARLDALGVNYRPLDGPTPGQARLWRDPRSRAAEA